MPVFEQDHFGRGDAIERTRRRSDSGFRRGTWYEDHSLSGEERRTRTAALRGDHHGITLLARGSGAVRGWYQ